MVNESEQRILDWFEHDQNYNFFDEIDYGEENMISDDADVQELIRDAESLPGNNFDSPKQKEVFNELWQGQIVPEWENKAKDNYNRAQEEIQKLTSEYSEIKRNVTRELREKIENVSDTNIREESEKELRRVNPQSYGQLKTTRVLRLRRDFNAIFG